MASSLIHSTITSSNACPHSAFPTLNKVVGFKHSHILFPKRRRPLILLASIDEKVPTSDSTTPSFPGFDLPEVPDLTKGDTLKSLKLKLLVTNYCFLIYLFPRYLSCFKFEFRCFFISTGLFLYTNSSRFLILACWLTYRVCLLSRTILAKISLNVELMIS